jgi:hypothetical protein
MRTSDGRVARVLQAPVLFLTAPDAPAQPISVVVETAAA